MRAITWRVWRERRRLSPQDAECSNRSGEGSHSRRSARSSRHVSAVISSALSRRTADEGVCVGDMSSTQGLAVGALFAEGAFELSAQGCVVGAESRDFVAGGVEALAE